VTAQKIWTASSKSVKPELKADSKTDRSTGEIIITVSISATACRAFSIITVTIQNKTLQVQEGHQGKADLAVTADSKTWLGFLGKEENIVWALVRRKIRVNGSLKLLQAFGKCFPA
jgi:putative sterol carrier protein